VHAAEARARIAAADDKAWLEASNAGTIVALNRYLGQFPDGAHVAQAKTSIAVLAQRPVPQKPAADTRRFDGTWTATISCTNASGARGYNVTVPSKINDGIFHAQRGIDGKPGWLTIEGKIEIDGSTELSVQGITDASAYTVGTVPPGTGFSYHIQGRFDGSSATGTRVELRPCNFTALKQH
jgi:hypothetical protein